MKRPIVYLAYANSREENINLPSIAAEQKEVYKLLSSHSEGALYRFLSNAYATRDDIIEQLQGIDRDHLIFFGFSGHATPETLELLDGTGHLEGLIGLIGACKNLKVVFLNGCSTVGMVKKLLDAGVHIVVATYQEVDDQAAEIFAVSFFENLANAGTVATAFEQAKSKTQFYRRDIQFESSRGLGSRNADSGKGVWGLFCNDQQHADWRLPSKRSELEPWKALPPDKLNRDKVIFPGMLIRKDKHAGYNPVEIRWRESRMVNLALHWGVSRRPFLACLLSRNENPCPRLLTALINAESLLDASGPEDKGLTRYWFDLPVDGMVAPNNLESFAGILAEQPSELARNLAGYIGFLGYLPEDINIGIVCQLSDSGNWHYACQWAGRFPSFSFVLIAHKDKALSRTSIDEFFQDGTEGRERFVAFEKPGFRIPEGPSPHSAAPVNPLKKYWTPANIPAAAAVNGFEKKAVFLNEFVKAYTDLEKSNAADALEKQEESEGHLIEHLRDILKFEPAELPEWIKALRHTGHTGLHGKMLRFFERNRSDALWDAAILAAADDGAYLSDLFENLTIQPDLLLALLRYAGTVTDTDKKREILAFVEDFLDKEHIHLDCEMISEIFRLGFKPGAGDPASEAFIHFLLEKGWKTWDLILKSGVDLPEGFLACVPSETRMQANFWHYIFRHPLTEKLLQEIKNLPPDIRKQVFHLSPQGTVKMTNFSLLARKNWDL